MLGCFWPGMWRFYSIKFAWRPLRMGSKATLNALTDFLLPELTWHIGFRICLLVDLCFLYLSRDISLIFYDILLSCIIVDYLYYYIAIICVVMLLLFCFDLILFRFYFYLHLLNCWWSCVAFTVKFHICVIILIVIFFREVFKPKEWSDDQQFHFFSLWLLYERKFYLFFLKRTHVSSFTFLIFMTLT